MMETERALERLLPGDLHSKAGLETFVNSLFKLLPHQSMFTLSADLLREMVMRFPPINLMIPLGYYKPADLIKNMDVRDVVSYSNLVESWSYSDRNLNWLVDELRPPNFEQVDIKPLVSSDDLPIDTTSHTRISNLNRITAQGDNSPAGSRVRGASIPACSISLQ